LLVTCPNPGVAVEVQPPRAKITERGLKRAGHGPAQPRKITNHEGASMAPPADVMVASTRSSIRVGPFSIGIFTCPEGLSEQCVKFL